jgi:hypothetical protein
MYPYEFGFREVGPVSVVCDASKPGSPISNSSDTAIWEPTRYVAL